MEIDWNAIYRINLILKKIEDIGKNVDNAEIKDGVHKIASSISSLATLKLNDVQKTNLISSINEFDEFIKDDKPNVPVPPRDRFITEDGKQIIEKDLLNNDPIIRQARPRMMILLGKASILYSIVTPLLVIMCSLLKVEQNVIDAIIKLILWQGATLWGSFTTSFTGYAVARSADKKIASDHDLGIVPSKLVKQINKIGHKIS